MPDPTYDLSVISARLGFDAPPEVLEAAATPLARGHHLALLAAEGSGKATALGLAVLETCDPGEDGLQALVLVPEAGHAWRVASALQRVIGPEGFRVACPSAALLDERPGDGTNPSPVHVLVGRPSRLLPEIRAGRQSISGLRLLVLDRLSDLRELEEWISVEPILDTLPEGARKVVVSDRADTALSELIDRQLPRARRWPEKLFPPNSGRAGEETEPASTVEVAVVEHSEFGAAYERCVRDADRLGCSDVVLVFRGPEPARRAAAALAVAGLPAEAGAENHRVRVELPGEGAGAIVHVGIPERTAALADAFEGDGPRYAVIEPRHLAQLDLYARLLDRRSRPLPGDRLGDELDPVRRYRLRVREEAEHADVVPELLLLEPLFEELGAVRVAAVLSGLLRRQDREAGTLRPWADVEAASSIGGTGSPAGRDPAGQDRVPKGIRPAWTRLYFGVGRRDEAKPGDLVGAITGETGIAGAQIGKIEVMGNFSLVDVDSQVADEVIRRLDGVVIRGREVPVRPDRGR